MIFVYPITIPPSTPKASAVVVTMPLAAGTIKRVNVQFPSGVVGLAFVSITLGLNQVFPQNPDQAFTASGETIFWDEEFPLLQEPYTLTAYGWNNDAVNAHTITLRFIIESGAAAPDLAGEVAKLLGSAATA